MNGNMKKVNEFLKNNGRQELSLDEAGQAVGGSFEVIDDTYCKMNG